MIVHDRTTSRRRTLAVLWFAMLIASCGGDGQPSTSDEPAGEGDIGDEADGGRRTDDRDAAVGRYDARVAADAAASTSSEGGGRDARAPVPSAPSSGRAEGDARDASAPAVDAAVLDAASESPVACPSMKLTPGSHEDSVEFGGHERTFLLHVGRGYTGDEPVPLVFDFHGYGQSVTSQRGASGFSALADQHGFAVVYPAGVGGSWHVDGCCGQAAQEKLDEVGAIRALLKQLQSRLCVDPKRVYASGISQGGGMAHHVGCLAADVFAAVAPVSSDLRTDPCTPSRPISELSFRGMADTLSAYEGGPVGPAGMQYQSIGAKPTLERWKMINQCTGQLKTTNELCQTYTECAAGVEVTLCSIPRGGHGLYTNPERFKIAQVAWEMFQRQRLR